MTIRPRRSVLYHARIERPRPRQGQDAAGRRRHPRSRGRGRARRQGDRAPAGGRRGQGRRLRPSRGRHPRQRPRHAVDRRRHRRRRVGVPDAILVPKLATRRAHRKCSASACSTCMPTARIRLWAMIETPLAVFNIARGWRRRRATPRRGCPASSWAPTTSPRRRAPARARPRADAAWLSTCVLAAHAYGVDILDGVYNDLSDADGLAARMRAGPRHGLRRQDADPSEPDRHLQRASSRRPRPRRSRGRRRSSPPSSCPRTRTRAWSSSTAAWSRSCTPTWRGARSPSPTRSRWRRCREGQLCLAPHGEERSEGPRLEPCGHPRPSRRPPPSRLSPTWALKPISGRPEIRGLLRVRAELTVG